jgi:hypothetical protein
MGNSRHMSCPCGQRQSLTNVRAYLSLASRSALGCSACFMMYRAMRWPSARPASVAYRKCHPSLTRESAHSAAAAAKLPNVRVGISGGAVVVVIVNDTSRPNASASTPNEAAHAAAWAEEYSGNGGVGRNGSQRGSETVFWLPSVSAARIAVYGRQWSYEYFASQVAT